MSQYFIQCVNFRLIESFVRFLEVGLLDSVSHLSVFYPVSLQIQ